MPHVVLEMSSNILEKSHTQKQTILVEFHRVLTELLPTQLSSCKSRAFIHDTYLLGDGSVENAFVHVGIKIMAGRSQDILDGVGEKLMRILEIHFAASREKFNCQLSIEIMELAKTYYKC